MNLRAEVAGCLVFAALLAGPAAAQPAGANYDEAKVPNYLLPGLLKLKNGEPVKDAATWNRRRRQEVLALFQEQVYGRSPGRPRHMRFELTSLEKQALGGKAVRKEVTVRFSDKPDAPAMHLLIYLPAGAARPVPVFLGLNFGGNHAVNADPGIRLGEVWTRGEAGKPGVKRPATVESRGSASGRWQVEKVLEKGYGLATVYYCDIEPDFDGGLPHSVRSLFLRAGRKAPEADEWGAIGAWAWGLSRALDYLETDRDVDAGKVAVMGHSRLGKTALWAAAQDTRFAMVISNDSGEGGAALSRRRFGETIRDLNTRFPHWFCLNYRKYNDREDEAPFDQHMLIALAAPRPVYVASAQEDLWADPRGEFLAAVNAGPVFELLGKQGLGTDQMPPAHQPIMNSVGYHIRAGKHDVTAYDWDQFLAFADKHLKGR